MDQYLTSYQRDYLWREITCPMGAHHMRIDSLVEPITVDCRAKAYDGGATGHSYEKPQASSPYGPGGSLSPRAVGGGGPTGINDKSGGAAAFRPPNFTKEELSEMIYKAAETGNIKPGCTPCGNKPNMNPLSQPTGKFYRQRPEPVPCPQPEKFRPIPPGKFGGQYEGPVNREYMEPQMEKNQANPYNFDNPCVCPPDKPENGPLDYGPAWIRSRVEEEPIDERMTGGKPLAISPEVAKLIDPNIPEARVSCAPEADVSKFDQPNSFMKKLYDKYPYLYQILRDTPPEELISRVFKDRFLSTYQVDYLHMGVGRESYQRDGGRMDEKYFTPEGEPEPKMIPGCSYRPSKKGEFGRKQTDLKPKNRKEEKEEEKEEEILEVSDKQDERVSEYMASISKLGGEIITDRLYALEKQQKAAMSVGKHYQ